eukprot:jgi/Chrzof1/6592/Cz19g01350.t1
MHDWDTQTLPVTVSSAVHAFTSPSAMWSLQLIIIQQLPISANFLAPGLVLGQTIILEQPDEIEGSICTSRTSTTVQSVCIA